MNNSIKMFYFKYKYAILFNKNIFIAAMITAVADVCIINFASITFLENYLLISIISLLADFLIYNISFIMLHFLDHKNDYINPDGSKNSQKIKEELKRLITIIGLAELSYLIVKFGSTFIIFKSLQINPWLISIVTTMLSWILYIAVANIMARNQKLFT